MKKILFLTGIMIAFTTGVFAVGRVVMENGACATCTPVIYSTISSAVAASSAGDTIFIKARAGDAPYVENVAITQSLDIVPYYNDSLWYCEGTWTINPTVAGSIVDIVGMVNLSGAVTGTSAPSGTRTTIRLLGGGMGFLNTTASATPVTSSGYICFNVNNYDVTVYGMKINNDYTVSGNNAITIKHGTIIGDSIVQQKGGTSGSTSYGAIYVSSENTVTTDTAFIIGNVISVIDPTGAYTYSPLSYALYGIVWNSWTMGFDIRNNLVLTQDDGINIDTVRNGISPSNKLYNNTINFVAPSGSQAGTSTGSYYSVGLNINPYNNPNTGAIANNAVVEVMDNLIAHNTLNTSTTNYDYGINCDNITSPAGFGNPVAGNSFVTMYYNYVDPRFSPILTGTPTVNNGYTNSVNLVLGTGPAISSIAPPTAGPTANAAPATTSLGYQTLSTQGVNTGNPGLANANLFGPSAGIYAPYSQNTVGAYGGPFDIQNYFAVAPNASNYTGPAILYMNSGSTRIFATPSNPTVTTIGSTSFSVKATSFDR